MSDALILSIKEIEANKRLVAMALAEYTDDEELSAYKKRILIAVGEGKINTFNLCLRLIKDNIALEDPQRKSTLINKELEHFSKVFLDGKATLKVSVNRDEKLEKEIKELMNHKDFNKRNLAVSEPDYKVRVLLGEKLGRQDMKKEIREWLEDNSDWDTCKDFDKEFEAKL